MYNADVSRKGSQGEWDEITRMKTDETVENWEACAAEPLVDREDFISILADVGRYHRSVWREEIVTQECATTLVQMASSQFDLDLPQLVLEESTRDQTVLRPNTHCFKYIGTSEVLQLKPKFTIVALLRWSFSLFPSLEMFMRFR